MRRGCSARRFVPSPSRRRCPTCWSPFGERVLGEREAREALGGFIADGFLTLLRESASSLEPVATESSLVHSDFNGKNLVLARTFEGAPRVEAVLDWEFAFSGPPLADVGNMLRRQERMPACSSTASARGSDAGGGALPPGWRSIAAALDAMALLDFLDRGAIGEHGPMYAEACTLIEEAVTRGQLAPPSAALGWSHAGVLADPQRQGVHGRPRDVRGRRRWPSRAIASRGSAPTPRPRSTRASTPRWWMPEVPPCCPGSSTPTTTCDSGRTRSRSIWRARRRSTR